MSVRPTRLTNREVCQIVQWNMLLLVVAFAGEMFTSAARAGRVFRSNLREAK